MDRVDFVAPANFNIKILNICGIWVTPSSSRSYKFYAFFMQTFFGFAFALDICLMLHYEEDLESFMLSFPISLTMTGYVIKLTNLYFRRHQIQEFFTLLNSDQSQVHENRELEIVRRANKNAKRLVQFWFWIFFTAGITAISPMVSKDPKVPYPVLYPDWRQGRKMFYISCVYQVVCIMVGSVCNGAIDAFISYFLTVLGGMIDALSWKLKTLKQIDQGDDTEAKREFLTCILRHKHLLRISAELQNVFSTVTFAQIFLSALIICGNLFQLSLLSPLKEPQTFFKLFCFSSAMFIQIFIPCYTANEVRLKSSKLMWSIYKSGWPGMSHAMKRTMVIFMQRLQRPIVITVGGILFLGMENFMVVLRASYSMYSFLRRVHAE